MYIPWHLLVRYGGLTGVVLFAKEYVFSAEYGVTHDLYHKTAIVTGASTGLGQITAIHLANQGACVIMACRDMSACRKAREHVIFKTNSKYVYCWECDLSSQKSIRKFVKSVYEFKPNIDYLINNAGVMHCARSTTKEGIETQLGTNYMGHFLLTNLLLDKLKKNNFVRIVNLVNTSYQNGKINFDDLNGIENYNPVTAFDQSQLAIMSFTKELSYRLHGSGISVHAVYPGRTFTDIDRHTSSTNVFEYMFVVPYKYIRYKTSRKGIQPILFTVLSPELDDLNGTFINDMVPEKIELPLNQIESDRLWKTAELWTSLSSG